MALPAHAKDDHNLAVNQDNTGSEKRITLVIGNSKYKEKSLANSANDARDVAVALRIDSRYKVIESSRKEANG